MVRKQKKGIRPSGRIVNMLADGKKTVLACSLVVVMAVMWGRVLLGRKPASAGAAPANQTAGQTEQSKQNKQTTQITMVEVPRVPGRNDRIGNDCFSMQGRTQFQKSVAAPTTGTGAEVPVVSPNRDQEVIQQVAQTLKLEAVLRNGTPLAFLNDRWVQAGDTFAVEGDARVLEFEVLRIYEDAVLVECNDIQLTLRLAQSVDVRK